MPKGRVEAFADGIFAFAITLLVVDINVPPSQFGNLWKGIADQWPAYLGFVTSFVTVGAIWMAHHAVFRRLSSANDVIMRLNLALLMSVAVLPFPTRLVAEAITSSRAERTAVIFYALSLILITALFAVLWQAILRSGLLKPTVTDGEIRAITRMVTPNVGFYVVVTLLALVAPHAAVYGLLLAAIVTVFRVRHIRGTKTKAKPSEG